MREYGFSLTCILPYIDRIVDSVFIRENTGQWKSIFSHIWCTEYFFNFPHFQQRHNIFLIFLNPNITFVTIPWWERPKVWIKHVFLAIRSEVVEHHTFNVCFVVTRWNARKIKFSIKVQSCKLYNNKYMITSTKITYTEIFAL